MRNRRGTNDANITQQSKEERRLPRPLSAKVPERYVWCVEETNGEKKKIERIE